MGCDIHMFVEVKSSIRDEETKWINYDHFIMNPYYNQNEDENDEDNPRFEVVELCGNRNYTAFTQLCGVRSYIENPSCISPPRGIPDDSCEYIKKQSELWDCDGHSHSYVTLKEIREYRENLSPLKINGMISSEQAKLLDEQGIKPNSWCSSTNDKDYVYREWEDYIDGLKNIHEALKDRAIEYFWSENRIKEDNIRIVFFFDN